MNIDQITLSFTEETNAFDYFTKAHQFIQQINQDDYAWKWAILALHGALYGFAICACCGNSCIRKIYKNDKLIDDFENSVVQKNGRLVDFDRAMELCQNPTLMKQTIFSNPLILTEEQKASINYLHREFRNNFEHFIPQSWFISLNGLPNVLINIMEIIKFLALESGNIILSQEQQSTIESMIKTNKDILQNHKAYVG